MNENIFTSKSVGLRMTYGKRLKKAMTAAGKSRKQLATELHCSVQAIGMVITGGGKLERKLSTENSVKAARYLKVDGYWLATGDGELALKPSDSQKTAALLTADALDIAIYFDKLKEQGERTRVYVNAMAEILKALAEREEKTGAQAIAEPAASETLKKQDA